MASICNHERGRLGANSGHEQKALKLSGDRLVQQGIEESIFIVPAIVAKLGARSRQQWQQMARRGPLARVGDPGLSAFATALGLSAANANALGTALNHFLNRVPATGGGQYTVKNLNDTKVTAEGLPFVSTTASGD